MSTCGDAGTFSDPERIFPFFNIPMTYAAWNRPAVVVAGVAVERLGRAPFNRYAPTC